MFELRKISKNLGTFNIENIDLKVDKGDYCVILGVSGAGKSMLLEMIAGLIKPDYGNIFLDDEDITNKKIQNRNIGLLFQDYAIFPHMTVRQNIEYPLKTIYKSKREREELVDAIAKELSIFHLLDRKPQTLSGGEQQRTSLARTLITKPHILLLDEPLSSLDIILKNELISILRNINRKGQTIIHVTHDYEEVISLANKVAIIENGKLIQEGKPFDVFNNPLSKFIANLSGIKNFFNASVVKDNISGEKVALIENNLSVIILTEYCDVKGNVSINSEEIILSEQRIDSSAVNNFEGIIKDIAPTALGVEISVDIGVIIYVTITKSSLIKLQLENQKKIWLCFKASSVKFYKN